MAGAFEPCRNPFHTPEGEQTEQDEAVKVSPHQRPERFSDGGYVPDCTPVPDEEQGESWTIGDCECGNVVSPRHFDKPCPECDTFHYAKIEVVPRSLYTEAVAERDEWEKRVLYWQNEFRIQQEKRLAAQARATQAQEEHRIAEDARAAAFKSWRKSEARIKEVREELEKRADAITGQDEPSALERLVLREAAQLLRNKPSPPEDHAMSLRTYLDDAASPPEGEKDG
jgi:hypothetical protein